MDPTFLLIVLVGLIAMMFFSGRARKKEVAQMQALQDSLEPGTWVRTGSGMYGIVDDVDGDVVILRTPGGDESYWDKRAISVVQDPPFAVEDDESEDEERGDSVLADEPQDDFDADDLGLSVPDRDDRTAPVDRPATSTEDDHKPGSERI